MHSPVLQPTKDNPASSSDKAPIFLVLMAFGIGVWMLSVGTELFPFDADKWQVPLWLVKIIGGIWILAGVLALGKGRFAHYVQHIFAALLFLCFTLLAGWIGFGPGERVFSGASPIIGRAIFGLIAILLFALSMYAAVLAVRTKKPSFVDGREMGSAEGGDDE